MLFHLCSSPNSACFSVLINTIRQALVFPFPRLWTTAGATKKRAHRIRLHDLTPSRTRIFCFILKYGSINLNRCGTTPPPGPVVHFCEPGYPSSSGHESKWSRFFFLADTGFFFWTVAMHGWTGFQALRFVSEALASAPQQLQKTNDFRHLAPSRTGLFCFISTTDIDAT